MLTSLPMRPSSCPPDIIMLPCPCIFLACHKGGSNCDLVSNPVYVVYGVYGPEFSIDSKLIVLNFSTQPAVQPHSLQDPT